MKIVDKKGQSSRITEKSLLKIKGLFGKSTARQIRLVRSFSDINSFSIVNFFSKVRCFSIYRALAVHKALAVYNALAVYKALAVYSALAVSVLLASSSASAQAEEDPLAPKPNLMWLSDDVNVSVFGDGQYDSFLGKSEVWTKNWGVSAKLLQNDNQDVFGLPKDSKYFNFDVKRRLLGSQDKSNLEFGLGWQELDIDSQLDASGPKVSVNGRYNVLRSFQVYGLTSYFPELEDDIKNTDATGYEIEAGLLYKPLPSWSLKAGYRVFSLDIEDPIVEELGSSSGFLLGTDLSW